ncbi:arylsulfatase I [Sitophilus oryzae]|uniref:Arylsulfatase I n=1 Tax=Sitophilus oryzae TaxID=7048 RepID=A0A6J2YVM3_SITOR|nr:arylsulfatase I [Sitophilus oryzae]XP_030767236.1 arylsulfatase I [Sitophilus oryzae]
MALFFIFSIVFLYGVTTVQCNPPHIIFIVADDLGFNDVGFHGSGQIPTPNIDALAYSGLILNNYYVNPICTPSRSALMTGKYPIHTGMQHTVLFGAEPRGLPLSEKILPQYLEELGYVNRIVGKWHLGSWKKEYTPLYRGFHSHLGYWTGHQDYFDHTAMEQGAWGLDMRANMSVAYDFHGKYSTDLFTQESVYLIKKHNPKDPLFLYLAHAAVHSGNPYNPLPVHDDEVMKIENIDDYKRRRFAAMMSKLDESVGVIINALKANDMLQNSIVVFTTDNGGPAAGFNLNAASNYPLKGVKNTLWEGGVRGAGLVWSPLIKKPSRVSTQFMHIVDWLPTLLGAASENSFSEELENLDGISIWKSLSHDEPSPRTEVLHNIDDIYGNAALTSSNWKLIQGATYDGVWDNWYGPSGRNYSYNTSMVQNSLAGKALKSINMDISDETIKTLRNKATIVCGNSKKNVCSPAKQPCLFNLEEDPCEYQNLANEFPDILVKLQARLKEYNSTALPPGNLPIDERGNPKYWNYVFTNFGDYENLPTVVLT